MLRRNAVFSACENGTPMDKGPAVDLLKASISGIPACASADAEVGTEGDESRERALQPASNHASQLVQSHTCEAAAMCHT